MAPRLNRAALALLLLAACGKEETAKAPSPAAVAPPAPAATTAAAPRREDRGEKAEPVAPEVAEMRLVVDGAPGATIRLAELEQVKPIDVEGDQGETAKHAWSARDVVAKVAGPKARLVGLKGVEANAVVVDATQWNDPARVPVLRINRRGLFKFYWSDPAGAPLPGAELRGVTELVVVTK